MHPGRPGARLPERQPRLRFLTIVGPGHARLFEQLNAEVTTLPADMGTVLIGSTHRGGGRAAG